MQKRSPGRQGGPDIGVIPDMAFIVRACNDSRMVKLSFDGPAVANDGAKSLRKDVPLSVATIKSHPDRLLYSSLRAFWLIERMRTANR